MLYRVFRMVAGASPTAHGGSLYVPRQRQGAGRHDNPARYGALYASRSPEGAVAEVIQPFRGRDITDDDLLLADGSALALAALDDGALGPLTDLDDPQELLADGWRPSSVASRDRAITQPMAIAIHGRGGLGLSWWSTLDSAWTNVTLFAERVFERAALTAGEPERLRTTHPVLIAAADRLAIPLVAGQRRRRRDR
jgi:hypothetical protein